MANKTVEIVFDTLPQDLAQMQALPQAGLATPFETAALTVAALCRYGQDADSGLAMLDFLKGPQPLTTYERQFLHDRFMDGHGYVPLSYVAGAVPANGYQPSQPYRVSVAETPQSYDQPGYAKLMLTSSGADAPRPVTLRQKDACWYLWEQFLLAGIRPPQDKGAW